MADERAENKLLTELILVAERPGEVLRKGLKVQSALSLGLLWS